MRKRLQESCQRALILIVTSGVRNAATLASADKNDMDPGPQTPCCSFKCNRSERMVYMRGEVAVFLNLGLFRLVCSRTYIRSCDGWMGRGEGVYTGCIPCEPIIYYLNKEPW